MNCFPNDQENKSYIDLYKNCQPILKSIRLRRFCFKIPFTWKESGSEEDTIIYCKCPCSLYDSFHFVQLARNNQNCLNDFRIYVNGNDKAVEGKLYYYTDSSGSDITNWDYTKTMETIAYSIVDISGEVYNKIKNSHSGAFAFKFNTPQKISCFKIWAKGNNSYPIAYHMQLRTGISFPAELVSDKIFKISPPFTYSMTSIAGSDSRHTGPYHTDVRNIGGKKYKSFHFVNKDEDDAENKCFFKVFFRINGEKMDGKLYYYTNSSDSSDITTWDYTDNNIEEISYDFTDGSAVTISRKIRDRNNNNRQPGAFKFVFKKLVPVNTFDLSGVFVQDAMFTPKAYHLQLRND